MAPEQVLTMHDVSNIWRVPLMLQDQGAHTTICSVLGLGASAPKIDMLRWKTGIADKWDSLREVRRRGGREPGFLPPSTEVEGIEWGNARERHCAVPSGDTSMPWVG